MTAICCNWIATLLLLIAMTQIEFSNLHSTGKTKRVKAGTLDLAKNAVKIRQWIDAGAIQKLIYSPLK